MSTGLDPQKMSRKKLRKTTEERRKVNEFCHSFAAQGSCSFGAECKFSHDYDEFLQDKAEFFNHLKQWRDDQERARTKDTSSFGNPFAYPQPPFHTTYESRPGEDTSLIIHAHNNGILALCLSPSHPASDMKSVASVIIKAGTFHNVGDELAIITSGDGVEFIVRTPLPGTLVEMNQTLASNPKLIMEDPLKKGFLVLFKAKSPFNLFLPRYFQILAQIHEYGDGE